MTGDTATLTHERFASLTLIGEGANGTTYRALDRSTGEVVALKTSRRHDDTATVASISAEGDLATRAASPHVVAVRDSDTSGDPAVLVLEYATGGNLGQRLSQRRVADRDHVAAVGKAVARALTACHGAGIVHRDLNPGNLLIHQPSGRAPHRSQLLGADEIIWLCDFGISRSTAGWGAQPAERPMFTRSGFRCPEEAQHAIVEPTTDIYAATATILCLVTCAPPPPADHIEDYAAQMPVEWARFTRKGMAGDPTQRPQSAIDWHESLLETLHAQEARR